MSDYLLIEKITGLGYAAAVHRDLLSGNGDDRIVVQDAQLPSPPLAAPNRADGLVPDRHFLPNRAIASAGGAATGIAADAAAALARWGYRLYGGRVLSPAGTTALSIPVTDGYDRWRRSRRAGSREVLAGRRRRRSVSPTSSTPCTPDHRTPTNTAPEAATNPPA